MAVSTTFENPFLEDLLTLSLMTPLSFLAIGLSSCVDALDSSSLMLETSMPSSLAMSWLTTTFRVLGYSASISLTFSPRRTRPANLPV